MVSKYLTEADQALGKIEAAPSGAASGRTDDDVILDAMSITKHIGAAQPRQLHSLGLRSAYERYSEQGEPLYTTCSPDEGSHCVPPRGVACADYIFYSAETLKVRRVATFPTFGELLDFGDDPREPHFVPAALWEQAPVATASVYMEQRLGGIVSNSSHQSARKSDIAGKFFLFFLLVLPFLSF